MPTRVVGENSWIFQTNKMSSIVRNTLQILAIHSFMKISFLQFFCPNILPILISFAYLVKRPWNAATSLCRKWCIYWRQTWTAKRPLSTNWRGNFKVWPILGWDISKPLIRKVRTSRGHLLAEKSTIHGTWYT